MYPFSSSSFFCFFFFFFFFFLSFIHRYSSGRKPNPAESFPTQLYDVAMLKTDVATGQNSRYNLQVLESDSGGHAGGGRWFLWRVWGRVGGEGGGGTKLEAYDSAGEAKSVFVKLFKEKSGGNEWAARRTFQKRPGYVLRFFVLRFAPLLCPPPPRPISFSRSLFLSGCIKLTPVFRAS